MQSNVTDLLIEAANLLMVGMSVVFVFLTLLIGAVQLIAFINTKLPAETSATPAARPRAQKNIANPAGVGDHTIAAISAAVHQYKQSR